MLSGSMASGAGRTAARSANRFRWASIQVRLPLHDRGDPAEVEVQGHNHRQAVGRKLQAHVSRPRRTSGSGMRLHSPPSNRGNHPPALQPIPTLHPCERDSPRAVFPVRQAFHLTDNFSYVKVLGSDSRGAAAMRSRLGRSAQSRAARFTALSERTLQVRTTIVFTLTGTDRVGIVDEVTQMLLDCGGNIETSRMARLGGEFAILVLVSLPSERLVTLEKAIPNLIAGDTRSPPSGPSRSTPKPVPAGCPFKSI